MSGLRSPPWERVSMPGAGKTPRFIWQTDKESEIWAEWVKNFEPYLLHAGESIREVAKISIENARHKRDNALREELQEAVFGRNY